MSGRIWLTPIIFLLVSRLNLFRSFLKPFPFTWTTPTPFWTSIGLQLAESSYQQVMIEPWEYSNKERIEAENVTTSSGCSESSRVPSQAMRSISCVARMKGTFVFGRRLLGRRLEFWTSDRDNRCSTQKRSRRNLLITTLVTENRFILNATLSVGCAPNRSPSSPAKDDLQGANEDADDDQQQKAKRTKLASALEARSCRDQRNGRTSCGRDYGINSLLNTLTLILWNLK